MSEAQDMEAPKEKKKGGKLKWIIIGVILLAVLGGGGWFAYTKFFAAPAGDQAATADGETAGKEGAVGEDAEPKDTQLVSLQPFVVNLADPLGRRYLKLTLDVEVRDAKAGEELTKEEPKVRDKVILLLSSKTFADLQSYESKLELKNEIVERLGQIVGDSKVLRVYFTEMVIQ